MPSAPGEEARIAGEARWPMAAAVVAAIVLTIVVPEDQRLVPAGVLPLIEGVLLMALIAGDPARSTGVRRCSAGSRSRSSRSSS